MSTSQFLKQLLSLSGRLRFKRYTLFGQQYKPMLNVLKELESRDIKINKLTALEVFGRDGLDHITTYANIVKSLEVWEIDEKLYPELIKNLPNADIKIVDSYEEIKTSTRKFDFIIFDNPVGIYSGHCDHFDFFPDPAFYITMDEALFVVNIIPDIDSETLNVFPNLSDKKYLDARANFYNTEDPVHISFDQIINTYKNFIESNNYDLVWSFCEERYKVYYLVLRIKRKLS